MAHVIMGAPLARAQGQQGLVRSRAWIWDCPRTRPAPGPADQGRVSAKARQMRLTVLWLRPERWAMDRVLQCVASLGVVSSVSVITRSTSSSVTARGRPLRGSSDRPSNRRSKNRERHFPTVSSDTAKSAATAMLLRPWRRPESFWPAAPGPASSWGDEPTVPAFPFRCRPISAAALAFPSP